MRSYCNLYRPVNNLSGRNNFPRLLHKRVYAIGLILLFSCGGNREKTNPQVEKITESVYAAGVIKAKNQYQVFSTVNGLVEKIFVKENDLVEPGTPILRIADQVSRLNTLNAGLSAQYADPSANRDKIRDFENNIALAHSKYMEDSLLYLRQQNLWKQDIGTKLDLEQKSLLFRNSKTAWISARLKYNDLVRQVDYAATQSRNNLAISKYRESDYVVKSEIGGRVYSIIKEQGEMAGPQIPLAIIGDASNFILELQVDEYDIVKVKDGQRLLVSLDSYKGRVFEAVITRINPIMNERSKSFTVEAEFLNSPPSLYPNLTAEANVVVETKEKALTIPRNYLVNDSFVLVAKNKLKAVNTGLKDYRKVEITGGLTATDVIYKPDR